MSFSFMCSVFPSSVTQSVFKNTFPTFRVPISNSVCHSPCFFISLLRVLLRIFLWFLFFSSLTILKEETFEIFVAKWYQQSVTDFCQQVWMFEMYIFPLLSLLYLSINFFSDVLFILPWVVFKWENDNIISMAIKCNCK